MSRRDPPPDGTAPPESLESFKAKVQPQSITSRRTAEHWLGPIYARRLSPYVSLLAVRAGLSANTVTGLMIGTGVAGALMLASQSATQVVAGALLLHLYLVLDCADGEVARWTETTGPVGIWLDRIGHYVVDALMFAAVGLRAAEGVVPSIWFEFGLVAALLAVLAKAESDLVDASRARSHRSVLSDNQPRLAGAMGALRRLSALVPVHRALGAVEFGTVTAVVAIADMVRGDLLLTRIWLLSMSAVALVTAIGHGISIVASDRLERP